MSRPAGIRGLTAVDANVTLTYWEGPDTAAAGAIRHTLMNITLPTDPLRT